MPVYGPIDIQQTRKGATVFFQVVPLQSALSTLGAVASNAEGFLAESVPTPTIYNLPQFDKVVRCRIYNELSGGAVIANTLANPATAYNNLQYIAHENRTKLNGVERRCNYTKGLNHTDISLRNLSVIEIRNTIFYHSIALADLAPNALFSANLTAVNRVLAYMKVSVNYTFA